MIENLMQENVITSQQLIFFLKYNSKRKTLLSYSNKHSNRSSTLEGATTWHQNIWNPAALSVPMGEDTKAEVLDKVTDGGQTDWTENVLLAFDHLQIHIIMLSDNLITIDVVEHVQEEQQQQ